MNQRLVFLVGGIAAVLLAGFAVWHAASRSRQAPAAAAAPAATPAATPAAPADTASTSTEDPTVNVPRIEPDVLLAHFRAADVTIIDVRDADSFLASHIPGALHIPLARIEGEVPYLPKGKPIVTYCT